MILRVCRQVCLRRFWIAALLVGVAPLRGQQSAPALSLNLVYLDPAHGGGDPGAHLTDSLDEKDVNLALAGRVKAALAAKGFTVLSTRDGDVGLTSDQRAELANHAHPVACILLHATSSGAGQFLAASGLMPEETQGTALPWDTAQAAYVSQSLLLLDGVSGALAGVGLKPVMLRASVPPIDSLTCAAVLLELAPMGGTPVTDAEYQGKVADALASALTAWKVQATPVKEPGADAAQSATPAAPALRTPKLPALPKPVKPVLPPAPLKAPASGPGAMLLQGQSRVEGSAE